MHAARVNQGSSVTISPRSVLSRTTKEEGKTASPLRGPRLGSDLAAGRGISTEVSSFRVSLGRLRVFYCVLETKPFCEMCSIKAVCSRRGLAASDARTTPPWLGPSRLQPWSVPYTWQVCAADEPSAVSRMCAVTFLFVCFCCGGFCSRNCFSFDVSS